MRKLLFLIQILLLMCTAYSQEKVFPITQINKRFVKVDEKMFVDKFEVTVNDYLTFLNEIKGKGGDISKLIYDSICWRYIGPEYLVFEEIYFNHNSFINYPMVGVSNFAAQEFCNWLTDKYNSDPNRKYNKVVFRLPTEQEFIKVALSKFDSLTIYPWGYSSLFNSKKEKCCNFFEIDQTRIDFSNEGFI